MDSVRIGILGGAGMRGKDFLRLFSRPKDKVEVVAIADTDDKALFDQFRPGVPRLRLYTDPQELLSAADINAVVIATPDWLHERHACAALSAGKHVYLEKPMAITPEGCDRIVETARCNNRTLYVGHNLRHFTVIKKLKELIDDGIVGDVKAVWCRHPVSYGRRAYFEKGRWHKKRNNVGSLLIHKGSHDLDVIHWLGGGHARRVVAMGTLAVWSDQPGNPDVEDLSSVLMLLSNGVQAVYTQCHFAHLACREYMIIGTNGTLRNEDDNPERAVVQFFGKRRADAKSIPTEEWRFSGEQGFHGDADKRIADEFIGILRGITAPTISVEDAAWAVKTGCAATWSLRNGNVPVEVF